MTTGKERREWALGSRADKLQEGLRNLDPQMAEWANGFVFGDVWGRPGLTREERMLTAVTILATGGHQALLENYLHGALQAGIAPRKLHEALVMLAVYGGFPSAVAALITWRRTFDAAVAKGVVAAEAL